MCAPNVFNFSLVIYICSEVLFDYLIKHRNKIVLRDVEVIIKLQHVVTEKKIKKKEIRKERHLN